MSLKTTPKQTTAIRDYIKKNWSILKRSHADLLACATDEKIGHKGDRPCIVYVSPQEDIEAISATLQEVISPEEYQKIELRTLPYEAAQIEEHGLLYLPGAYVVPGGRFNEIYGWDSYFIQIGLLRDGEIALAKSQVEQLMYQVKHYGTVLNANRSYLLGRSQQPFLSLMVLAQFEHDQDFEWLQSTIPTLENFYYFWVVPPHLNQATGLSRFFALGDGPAPEVVASERDEEGKDHYERVREYYSQYAVEDYDVTLYYDQENNQLTDLFYKGDRSMRESGFDITNRFGPFSADIIHYAPVCLNSLLYQMELDMAQIQKILGYPEFGQQWLDRAAHRQELINRWLWCESRGLYLDYNFRTEQHRDYIYATTFYPLWVGLASPEQAAALVKNLPELEAAGGLLTSASVTGNQWDAPFGWAPLNLMAVEGLLRYGYEKEAKRLAAKFVDLIVQEFEKNGTIVEKYDVIKRSARVSDEIFFGYSSNEVGFGWTNGVFLKLLDILAT